MINGHQFHDIIKNIFVDVKGLYVSEQIQVCCPKCEQRDGLKEPDGKFNLEINTQKKIFRCWKCENPYFSGTLGKLIKTFGSPIDYELYRSLGGLINVGGFDENEEEYSPIYLPPGFIPFSELNRDNFEHMEAYRYLVLDRNIPFEKIIKFRLGFCITGKYSRRIIIPSYNISGELDYFVARNYDKHNKSKPPYDNPKHDKKSVIFNEKYVNYDSLVFLVEGVFDMFTLPNSIPLLGKEMNEGLYFRLREFKPWVVVALDPDARKQEYKIYESLKNMYGDLSNRVRILKLEGNRDVDEINRFEGKEELLSRLYKSTTLVDDDYFSVKQM